jgi:hypothetical protein
MRRQFLFLVIPVLLVLTVLFAGGRSLAQGPDTSQPQASVSQAFTYQGQLKDSSGNPINNTCDFSFSLWNALAAGTQVGGNSSVTDVQVTNGYFAAQVNAGGEFGGSAFTGDARWLEIAVQCSGDPASTTLSPRQELTAAPYALGLMPGAKVVGAVSGGAAVRGENTATDSASFGLYGLSASTDGRGVLGEASTSTGTTFGVIGTSFSPDGRGVQGGNYANTGWAVGVRGANLSPEGRAVVGNANATHGANVGVYGVSASDTGTGVLGAANATSGANYGVYGSSASGVGVYGTGPNAVVGISSSPGYAAVYGQNDASNGIGVYGLSASTAGTGVYGTAPHTGTMGIATTTSGWGVGVYGLATSNYAYGVGGRNDSGIAVQGSSQTGTGVQGATTSGRALHGWVSGTGIGLVLESTSTDADFIKAGWFVGPDTKFLVDHSGNVYADGSYQSPAPGFAEMLPGAAGLEAGDVLVVGPDGSVIRCSAAYQPTVVGVYAPQSGFVSSSTDANATDKGDKVPVAVMGFVLVKVSAENGPIAAGDLLVAAATPGHAMKAGANAPQGTVIGKALGQLDNGTGTLLMLVMPR